MDRPSTSKMVAAAKAAVADHAPTNAIPAFLQKLCEILEQAPQDIVSWLPHGRSFMVKNVDRFSAVVLAKHFKSSNFASFVRQLNFYGFHKIAGETKKVWEFKHDKFRRDVPALLYEIRRKTSADYVAPEHSDLLELKGEVSTLRAQVAALTTQLSAVLGILQNVAPEAIAGAGLTDAKAGVAKGGDDDDMDGEEEPSDDDGGAAASKPAPAVAKKAPRGGKKASGGAGRKSRASSRRASISSSASVTSSSASVAPKRRRAQVASDSEESGAESARARVAGTAAATLAPAKAEPQWTGGASGGAAGAVPAPYGGELPSELMTSFQTVGLGGDTPMEAVGPIDLTQWLDEADFPEDGSGVGGVSQGNMDVDGAGAGAMAPPALGRSISGGSVSGFFNSSTQSPAPGGGMDGPATPADLPTQAVLGATSTLLNQLPAAAFLTHLMAASAASNFGSPAAATASPSQAASSFA